MQRIPQKWSERLRKVAHEICEELDNEYTNNEVTLEDPEVAALIASACSDIACTKLKIEELTMVSDMPFMSEHTLFCMRRQAANDVMREERADRALQIRESVIFWRASVLEEVYKIHGDSDAWFLHKAKEMDIVLPSSHIVADKRDVMSKVDHMELECVDLGRWTFERFHASYVDIFVEWNSDNVDEIKKKLKVSTEFGSLSDSEANKYSRIVHSVKYKMKPRISV
jgi:hypothetical protein